MRANKISSAGDNVTLTTIYDPTTNYELNYRARMENYRQLTQGKTMMPVASIPIDDLERLVALGDLDAIAVDTATEPDILRQALRRLLAKYPEFRISEARI
jgi:hypothetical protein